MSLSGQHYQDQHRGRKGRQKPPSETGKQHGCEVKRRVQDRQKKGLE